MHELQGKTVLLVAPKFFGYELEIKKELENFGAKVIYFDERPRNDFFTKVFIRLDLKTLIQKKIDVYYENIMDETKDEKIDYLFLVNPETIDVQKIQKIKHIHPAIKVYTYMWDSIKNKKKSLVLLPESDRFFTFDSNDKVIDEKIEFLPLFYISDYQKIADEKSDYLYDISFIGTVHSDRYNLVKEIEVFSKVNGLKTFFYFYSPSKVLFFFQKLFKKDFRNIDRDNVSFDALSKDDVLEIIKKSKAVIDMQHPLQSGLTMRTIEMLGARRKLLTTNQNIQNYDFYDTNNIYIIDRENPVIDNEFFALQYKELEDKIYEKYSLKHWIGVIFA